MVQITPRGTHRIIELEGELNASSARTLKALIQELLEAGPAQVVVDLGRVSFIDSSGLGALVSALKRTRLAGGSLALAALREEARLIFELTMAYRIFDMYDSVEAAMAAPGA